MTTPPELPSVAVYAGDDEVLADFVVNDSDGAEPVPTLTPVDLSIYTTWEAQWRPTALSDTVLALTVDDSDAVNGHLRVLASAEVTRAMGGKGVWDLQTTSPVKTWYTGKTTWKPDVTR